MPRKKTKRNCHFPVCLKFLLQNKFILYLNMVRTFPVKLQATCGQEEFDFSLAS